MAPDAVIPVNILNIFPGQIGNGGKVLTVIHLRFQVTKEIFHHRVIEPIALARHGLHRTVLREQLTPRRVMVLKTLVRVHQQSRCWRLRFEGLGQAGTDKCCCRRSRDRMADDAVIKQIHDR